MLCRTGNCISRRALELGTTRLSRLVDQHLSSKEIAAELKISPHTVDQRIRQALQILDVARRHQAARIVAQHGGLYQRLIHQSPHIEGARSPRHPEAAASKHIGTLAAQGRSGSWFPNPAEARVIPAFPATLFVGAWRQHRRRRERLRPATT